MNPTPKRSQKTTPQEVIEAAAAAWLSLRDQGMSASQTAEFVTWLQQDPQHAAVFAELDAIWRDFDRLGAAPQNRLVPDADLLAPRVVRRRNSAVAWVAFGAAIAAIFLFLASPYFRVPRHAAETVVGAFQRYELPDGSLAELNTDSAIDIDFTPAERRVRIVRGEVFFTVTKNPGRPFIVTSGSVAVRAVGTAFNVRQHGTTVEVLVTEGRVSLYDSFKGRSLLASSLSTEKAPLLVAGERAIVPLSSSFSFTKWAAARVEEVSAPVAQRALAWQEQRLVFDSSPLSEVASEFNRYNRHQLIIGDTALATKCFSGTFRTDGYESLVRLLESDFGVKVTRSDNDIVLHIRR